MKSLLLAFGLTLGQLIVPSVAQDANKLSDAIPIRDSQSPDGRKHIAIVDSFAEAASGTVQILDDKTGKVLGYFDWSGFGSHVTDDAFTVLWRPDSRAFAISYEVTRGYVKCEVYALENDRCVPVQLPNYVARVASKYGLKIYSKGSEHPVKWLSGNRLVVDVYNRSWGEDGSSSYRVTLRLPLHPVATIEKISPAP